MSIQLSALVREGIAALRTGDKDEAVKLFAQAIRENRDDESAWLYMGTTMDDPVRKRQAFEQVIRINPNNEQAKQQLAQMNGGAAKTSGGAKTTATGSTGSKPSSSGTPRTMPKLPNIVLSGAWLKRDVSIPFNIPGKPRTISIVSMLPLGRREMMQSVRLYASSDSTVQDTAVANKTWWDSIVLVVIGTVVIGLAQLIGEFVGRLLLIGHVPFLAIVLSPILSTIIVMLGAAVGFAAGILAAQIFLESQRVTMDQPQHARYYAQLLFPILLVEALMIFLSSILNLPAAGLLVLIPVVVLTVYIGYILKEPFERLYGVTENRGLITAGLTVGAGLLANWATVGLLWLIFQRFL